MGEMCNLGEVGGGGSNLHGEKAKFFAEGNEERVTKRERESRVQGHGNVWRNILKSLHAYNTSRQKTATK